MTDKPKWWQSWIVYYGLVALLAMMVPYVSGSFLLGGYGYWSEGDNPGLHYRIFNSQAECIVFGPLAWAEAEIRGEPVAIKDQHGRIYGYEPGR